MPSLNIGLDLTLIGGLIDFGSTLLIAAYAGAAVLALLRGRGYVRARLLLADGVLLGLSIKLAATLLKLVVLTSWPQILAFASILALRTLLKQIFAWERRKLTALL